MLEERLSFENYQNISHSELISCDRVVVQAESLHRLDMSVYREDTILVLDEVSSLFRQMCSHQTMGSWFDFNNQMFRGLIKRATRVICLDADLCQEEVDILTSIRDDFIVVDNTFQQQKGDNVVLFESELGLIKSAQEQLQAGKRLWISSTMSADKTEAVHATFKAAGFSGVCVTKNTPESVKKDVGRNINAVMKRLDYFIHTPTVSVGVNYDSEDGVDLVVGLFSTHSQVDVETSMQMMRRARHVKQKTYWVYADGATNNLPDTASGIREWLSKQSDIVTRRDPHHPAVRLEFDDDHERLVMPDDLFHNMYCHVTALRHRSMNNFRARLLERATQAGCIVTHKSDRKDPIRQDLKEKETEITAARHQQTASAAPISADEFEELVNNKDLDEARLASMHKFALMRTYGVDDHSIITEEWVEAYDSAREKEYFKNLQALAVPAGGSLRSRLAIVRQYEDLGLECSLEKNATSAEAHCRLERSQYAKLKPVVDILTACGFEDTRAMNEVLAADLKTGLDDIWPALESGMPQLCTTLKIRRPASTNWTFKNKLAYINTILHAVLGVKIKTPQSNGRRTKYCLKHDSKVGSAENSPLKAQTQIPL